MESLGDIGKNGPTRAQQIGLALGLVLFILLLLIPTPRSMRDAVRTGFAGQVQAEVAAVVHRESADDRGANGAAEQADSNAGAMRQAVEEQVVETRARRMLAAGAVTALVACWWITVAVPIPVTSLLPIVLFPIVGVMPVAEAAVPYANSNVFLFMGGFIIALGIERWGLHRRIALHIVRLIGTSRSRIVLGFMIASALLSMWISNTAATLMMLPIGLAIISAVGELDAHRDPRAHANFGAALMLGIAYAASIGGMATPIGTPPNIAFKGQYARLFPDAPEITFGHWMLLFVPLVVVFLPVIWLILVRVTCPVARGRLPVGREVIAEDLRKLGPIQRPEAKMLAVFLATAVLWMTRSLPIGETDYGWSGFLERWLTPAGEPARLFHAGFIDDATVALGMASLLFLVPVGGRGPDRRLRLMNWQTAQRLPWGILLLFGGGFSIAAGFQASGLSFWCGQVFASIPIRSPILVVGCTCLLLTFMTEVTSNTATTQVMLPILAKVSQAVGLDPLMVMLPATISASCAFMLPVATPPNAIVFGSGHVEMRRMVRSGLIINFVGVVLVTATFYFFAARILGLKI